MSQSRAYGIAMLDIALSLAVLAALALLVGAYFTWRRSGDRKQALLMVVLALVAILNVAIWTVPDASDEAPLDKIERGHE